MNHALMNGCVHARARNHRTAIKDEKVPNMPTHAYCMQYPCVHVCTDVKFGAGTQTRARAHIQTHCELKRNLLSLTLVCNRAVKKRCEISAENSRERGLSFVCGCRIPKWKSNALSGIPPNKKETRSSSCSACLCLGPTISAIFECPDHVLTRRTQKKRHMYKLSCMRSLAQTHSLTYSRAFPGFLTLFEWFVHLLCFSLSLSAHRYVCGKKTKNKWKSGNDWFSKTINTIVFGNEVFFFLSRPFVLIRAACRLNGRENQFMFGFPIFFRARRRKMC